MEIPDENQKQKNVERIIDRIITLIKYRLWGNLTVDRFRTWQKQFETEHELYYAIYLAQQLVYYSKKDILSMISYCIANSIKGFILNQTETLDQSYTKLEWNSLMNDTKRNTLVCPLFIDSPAASGYLISRMLRDQGLIAEDELCNSYEQLIYKLKRRGNIKGIIFVDDMMGSGEQAKSAFKDTIDLDGKETSLKRYLEENFPEIPVTICVAVTPAQTLQDVEEELGCIVIAGEVLTGKHDVLSSLFWGEKRFDEGQRFLQKMQQNYRIPLTGHGTNAWSVTFEHGTPDNTSPFYYASPNGWTSLIRYRGEDV
ncbi:phosphoribosyltransferase-like protein [Paenibacillus sp. HGF5]|uniref:phosphoribosyltransferase-like protein n=1 Tax=Paenibacillus sp. HGF5 TaxID=908341 RepID=UPI0002072794|nr:hypothetical protein [Paenibacillus sp. HGF5]EGG34825.1 hypothetical protein HMPREF9412_3758 [Paenibacillus sp. HGF5]